MQPTTPPSPITARRSATAQKLAFRRLRLRRFGMALMTYVLGFALLSVCAWLGLLPVGALLRVGALFLLINVFLALAFASGWNERWADPSLTVLQMGLAVSSVAVILVVGRDTQFVAAPFYSVLFVFGMLQLRPRQIAGMTLYLLLSYATALALRLELFGDALDLRVEAVTAVLVVCSATWFSVAAGYISNLRTRLRESRHQIQVLATRDSLTGLWNRRYIDMTLEAAVQHAASLGTPLCVVLVDVDHRDDRATAPAPERTANGAGERGAGHSLVRAGRLAHWRIGERVGTSRRPGSLPSEGCRAQPCRNE